MIQALELHGYMFPGSPLLHPDNDKWKHTLFTNKPLYFSNLLCQNYKCKNSVKNVLICAYLADYQSSDGYKLK